MIATWHGHIATLLGHWVNAHRLLRQPEEFLSAVVAP